MAVNGNPSLQVQKDSMKVEITGSVSSQQQMTINTTNLNAVNSGTTMAALVSNLSTLVGNTNSRNVTAYITSRPPISISSNIGHISKPVMVTHGSQPLLLPKPTQTHKLPQKQHIQSTPPKFNNTFQNSSVLTSPLHTSPAICPSPLQSGKRSHVETTETDTLDSKRRRGPDKGGKGLRHFSMKVCEKVQLKGVTSYNEVADELVQEFSDSSNGQQTPLDQSYDQKNIRRRVYDALNVLMAMNIITKEKKEIKWVGLPTNSAQECKRLEEQKKERIERIKQKKHQLRELIVQQIAFKNLVERNKRLEKKNGAPQSNACIHLPFIIVNTSKKTVIDCSISSDKSEYLFNFDEAFEIRDDIEVLKRLGLSFGLDKGECSEKNLRIARNMVPKALAQYVNQMANGNQAPVIGPDGSATSPPLAQPLTQRSSPGPSSKCDESENDGDDEHSSIMTS